ncbi:MAG: phosphoglycerate kinase [Gemmatimonadota bacterium]
MRRRVLSDLAQTDLRGRRVVIRVDYNVPLDEGRVTDPSRVTASLDSLKYILEAGGRPVILSHLGRPQAAVRPEMSLRVVVPLLEEGLGRPVRLLSLEEAESAASSEAESSESDEAVLLVENTRFLEGETRGDPDLARRFANLGDVFVNDAFGTLHRAHASVAGVAELMSPAVAGFLVERELRALSALRAEPESPFVVVFGGAKIGDKIALVDELLERSDRVLVGGAMANTFLRAMGHSMGDSLVEEDSVELARSYLSEGSALDLPTDLIVAPGPGRADEAIVVPVDSVPDGMAALDIGPETQESFSRRVLSARTLFWNGPMGLFESQPFAGGTIALARAAAEATRAGAFTVVGGGDSAAAVRQAGLDTAVSHVSTGGGAALEFLAQGTLPGLESLDEASA